MHKRANQYFLAFLFYSIFNPLLTDKYITVSVGFK